MNQMMILLTGKYRSQFIQPVYFRSVIKFFYTYYIKEMKVLLALRSTSMVWYHGLYHRINADNPSREFSFYNSVSLLIIELIAVVFIHYEIRHKWKDIKRMFIFNELKVTTL